MLGVASADEVWSDHLCFLTEDGWSDHGRGWGGCDERNWVSLASGGTEISAWLLEVKVALSGQWWCH